MILSSKNPIDPTQDLCWLPYSSGTTGLPKGVMHTHQGFMLHLKAQLRHAIEVVAKAYEMPTPEFTVLYLPVYHAMGFFTMLNSILRGQTMILMKKYTFKRFLEFIEKYKIPDIRGVPSTAHQFLKDPIVKNYDLSSIRLIGTGGSKLDDASINELFRRFPKIERIGQGYGMTEAVTGIVMSSGRPDQPTDSVGIALPGCELKVSFSSGLIVFGFRFSNKVFYIWLENSQLKFFLILESLDYQSQNGTRM